MKEILLSRSMDMEYVNGFWCVPVSVLKRHNVIIKAEEWNTFQCLVE